MIRTRKKTSSNPKKTSGESFLEVFFVYLFSFLFTLLLLTLGSDTTNQKIFRMSLCLLFVIPLVLQYKKSRVISLRVDGPAFLFAIVVIFQIVRAGFFYINPSLLADDQINFYQESLFRWSCYFIIFTASSMIFTSKRFVNWFSNVLLASSFFIAINAIPALFANTQGTAGYEIEGGGRVFFYPLFYFHDWVGKFFLGKFAHPNYTGDLIAIGFFVAMGTATYLVREFLDRKKKQDLEFNLDVRRNFLASILFRVFIASVVATAAVMFFSRGTILCFAVVVLIYFVSLMIRFKSIFITTLSILLVCGTCAFVAWSVDTKELFQEMQTLEGEMDSEQLSSFSSNREGFKRAIGIYKDHKIWGVGTRGYKQYSELYASEGTLKTLWFTKNQSMNHYVHTLAEEGLGAWFYFAFVICFFIFVMHGLISTRSYYKFVMILSYLAPVVMILLHATFNHLMQRFSMSMIVYALMGVCLGLCREKFKHD